MVPSASSASIAASTRCRSLSSGRNSPAAMFQFKSGSLSNAGIRRNGLSACCWLNQPTVAGVTAAASISRLASGAAILDRTDHPLPRQLDTELLGNFLAELDLKSRYRSGLAGER